MARVLVIDNHDSLAWNLAQRLGELGDAMDAFSPDPQRVVGLP